MRYVQNPHPVALFDRITKKYGDTLTFQQYAHQCWLNDTRWETPKTNLARLIGIVDAFGKAPGEWIELEDQDWTILKSIIDVPGTPNGSPNLYVPLVQIQVGPAFEGAILDAPSKDPRAVLNGTKEEATAS